MPGRLIPSAKAHSHFGLSGEWDAQGVTASVRCGKAFADVELVHALIQAATQRARTYGARNPYLHLHRDGPWRY